MKKQSKNRKKKELINPTITTSTTNQQIKRVSRFLEMKVFSQSSSPSLLNKSTYSLERDIIHYNIFHHRRIHQSTNQSINQFLPPSYHLLFQLIPSFLPSTFLGPPSSGILIWSHFVFRSQQSQLHRNIFIFDQHLNYSSYDKLD